MRRLFSSFARGAPGAGLLLMRLATGGALIVCAIGALGAGLAVAAVAFDVLLGALGILVLIGLWTPIAGALAAVAAVWCAYSRPPDVGFYLLLATLAGALALLGPGAWSLDARLFGWKRVEIGNGKSEDRSPF